MPSAAPPRGHGAGSPRCLTSKSPLKSETYWCTSTAPHRTTWSASPRSGPSAPLLERRRCVAAPGHARLEGSGERTSRSPSRVLAGFRRSRPPAARVDLLPLPQRHVECRVALRPQCLEDGGLLALARRLAAPPPIAAVGTTPTERAASSLTICRPRHSRVLYGDAIESASGASRRCMSSATQRRSPIGAVMKSSTVHER